MSFSWIPPSRRADLGLRILLFALQIAALAWFAPNPLGLPLDDAWIHQVVARTFAETHTLGYAAGQHGAAATSYLWALLLAMNFMVIHVDPVKWAFALNAIGTVGAGQLLFGILGRTRPVGVTIPLWRSLVFGAVLVTMIQGHVLWYAWSGMEASGLVALSLAAIAAASAERPRPLLAGLCAGLLAVLRPEAMALGVVLVVYSYRRSRHVSSAALLLLPWLLAIGAYVGSNLLLTGHASPATLSGRRWLWFDPVAGTGPLGLAHGMIEFWSRRIATYGLGDLPALFYVGLGLCGYGAVRLLRTKSDGVVVLYVWALLHTLFYVVMLPTPGHGGRYQPFVPIVYLLSACVGTVLALWDLFRLARLDRKRWVALGGLFLWGIASGFGAAELRTANELAVRHIVNTELAMGHLVDELPPDAVVASFDIGGIGWATRRRIIDLGGLSDAPTAKRIEEGRTSDVLLQKKVTHVVLPEAYDAATYDTVSFDTRLHLEENASITLEPIRVVQSPPDTFWRGADATWNAAPRQVMYAVTPAKGPAPRVIGAVKGRQQFDDPEGRVLDRERPPIERSLAVMTAWGTPVGLRIGAGSGGSAECGIGISEAGVSIDGCAAFGRREVVASYVTERVLPYIDARDWPGAGRESLHALSAVKRRIDPTFYPSIVPNPAPNASDHRAILERTGAWGIPLAVVVFLVFVLGIRMSRVALVAFAVLPGCVRPPPDDLADAARRGDVEVVARLVRDGVPIDSPSDEPPLLAAVRGGHADAIAILARATHAVDAASGPRKRTALHDAMFTADADGVRLLLAAGADPNRPDAEGDTPLHVAVTVDESRAPLLVPLLLAAGADPKRVDFRGFSPLHAAARAGNAAAIKLLGASEAKTPSGDTALDLALRYQKDRAAEALLAAGAASAKMPPMQQAARMDDVVRAAALLGGGCDLSRLFEGKTALDVARRSNSKRVEQLLLGAGAK